ncbi:unnamed protein product [Soboliphyme baturini]|uniref:Protein KTI12 homolog n=1 Tax=Soboliphyme baturini TaxID=241478 RepID=A0A183IEX9_9BILA|nr:unnamed protein product [Soboliphyme baturini]
MVRIIRDAETGNSKGIGFVVFKDPYSVPFALKLDGDVVEERNIRVSRVFKKKAMRQMATRENEQKQSYPSAKKTKPKKHYADSLNVTCYFKMSVVLITGYPSSGKSMVASMFKEYLVNLPDAIETLIVSDEAAQSFNREIYLDAKKEIQQRSFLKSEVHRLLGPNRVVIFDSLNYIKGYRYEIYCLAKAAECTYGVLFLDATIDNCLLWNDARKLPDRYSEDILKSLHSRFEVPVSSNRWENPLFTYRSDEMQLHFPEIVSCVMQGRPLKPNLSTRILPITGPDFLYSVDQKLQEVVRYILAEQRLAEIGDAVCIKDCEEKLFIKKIWSALELANFKRQFINYVKTHPVLDEKKLMNMFIVFINNA